MSESKIILVIDTALEGCGVAVYDQTEDCNFELYDSEAHGQAQKLVPMVQDVLGKAGIGFESLSSIVVVIGPGTFTGIRIGLSTAKAFALALNIPLWGVSSLQALALCARANGDVFEDGFLSIVETRRDDFYVQAFDSKSYPQLEARSLLAEDIGTLSEGKCLIGNGVKRFGELTGNAFLNSGIKKIDVGVIGRVFSALEADGGLFTPEVEPIYLRAPDVSQPKHPPRHLLGA